MKSQSVADLQKCRKVSSTRYGLRLCFYVFIISSFLSLLGFLSAVGLSMLSSGVED